MLEELATVLLVSSEWQMRRVLLTVQATFPQGIRFVCCPTLEDCTWGNRAASRMIRYERMSHPVRRRVAHPHSRRATPRA